MRVEVIVYKGIKFRRYPDSERMADRRYYRPHVWPCLQRRFIVAS